MKYRLTNRSFALLLVLIMVVLAATIATLFLASTGRERQGTDSYARSGQVRDIAKMAVSRVIGEINAATKEGTAAVPVSWSSQPGMVRTYAANGDPSKVYKLYSWDNPVETIPAGGKFDPSAANQLPPSGWSTTTALFTDLNQSVNDIYPIVDPRAEANPGLGRLGVEGFSVDETNPVVGAIDKAPMPVKWLYVLENGNMVAPSNATGTTATVPGESATNRIVGRVAFWTDDETSKVNINTASEGAFWDWPKAGTYNEMQFSGNPPVDGEFNRIPGHPAMTSLSAVFPELDPGDRWSTTPPYSYVPTYRTKLAALLDFTPRVPYKNITNTDGSSRGGTYPMESAQFDYGPDASSPAIPAIPSTVLTLKTDRLFVSPDEFDFTYPNHALAPTVTPLMLSQRGFFLTSQSRAPETTLFETPRVSLWPVTWPYPSAHASLLNRQTAAVSNPNPDSAALKNDPWMRAEERLLAFTSTLDAQDATRTDGLKYYFQRQNPESPTADYTNIKRNRELLAYLQRLTGQNVPGFGGSFVNQVTAPTRDFILANTFNSVRSLVNQYTLDAAGTGSLLYAYTGVSFARFKNKLNASVKPYNESGAFSPIPLKLDLGSGPTTTLSEFPLLHEAAVVFYATSRLTPGAPNLAAVPAAQKNQVQANPWNWTNLINLDPTNGYPLGARTNQMRAFLALDFSPVRGSTRNNQPVFWVKITGPSFSANGTSINFGNATCKMDFRQGGYPSFMLSMYKRDAAGNITGVKDFNNGAVSDTNYGLISSAIGVSPNATTFQFTGTELVVDIYGIKNGNPATDPTTDSSLLITSYKVDFSSWSAPSYPIPLAPYWTFIELDKTHLALPNPLPFFPNPNFKGGYQPTAAAIAAGAKPAELRETKWADLEITTNWTSATSASDPNGVWLYKNLYIGSAAKPLTEPTDGSINTFNFSLAGSNPWGYPPIYVYADNSGPLMIDPANPLTGNGLTGRLNLKTGDPNKTRTSGNPITVLRDDVWGADFPLITAFDTVMSVIVDPGAANTGDGDPRLALNAKFISSKTLLGGTVPPTPLRQILTDADYDAVAPVGTRRPRQYHAMGDRRNAGYITKSTFAMLASNLAPNGMATLGGVNKNGLGGPGGTVGDGDAIGVVSSRLQASIPASFSVGDWTSSPGVVQDGGRLVRPDQDSQSMLLADAAAGKITGFTYQTPYFRLTDQQGNLGFDTISSTGYFSANRQIPSPITLLGGLPSSQTKGWQTLAFSPNPAAPPAGGAHPGLASASNKAPDHLLLDLFWMPVAEPYPISEEFSTAGKINLNYKIAPFNYITRRTGLHALMKATWLTAINSSLVQYYKSPYAMRDTVAAPPFTAPPALPNRQTRYKIDPTQTLDLFDTQVFNTGDIFRSASQLCEMFLVPVGTSKNNIQSFWNSQLLLTSDTAREEPYDHLYSRVTTKSNTYTVHWRAQVVRKIPGELPTAWDEKKDRVLSELRGSTLIERYIDPNATTIPDYATDTTNTALPLSQFYKWRTVAENYFQP